MSDDSTQTAKPPRSANGLHRWGVFGTVAWLAIIAAYVGADWQAFISLAPNEYGDFFAGAFAPLAFLWLVLGFFQQGEELRHSAEALWLQGRELQNSVEQQRELVSVTREQLALESEMLKSQRDELMRSAQPRLQVMSGGNMSSSPGLRLYNFFVANHGNRCTDLRVAVDGTAARVADVLETGMRTDFNRELPVEGAVSFDVHLTYLDQRLMQGSKTVRVTREGATFKFEDLAEK